jgi:hypothetical protein
MGLDMKFTLRDLFWLTLVIAIGAGWFVHARGLLAAKKADNRRCALAVAELTKAINELYAKYYALEMGEALEE